MALNTHLFKSFPEFSRLTLADKEAYEALIAQYPPIADISFAGLINWWDAFDSLAIANLNNNLVISYWLPGWEKYSGLALVGTNKVDESLCTIFDYQKEKGESPKVMNVPEVVLSHVQFPELFIFKEQRALSEYIYSLKKFYPLENMPRHRRRSVRRFEDIVGEQNIVVKAVDLQESANRRLLLGKTTEWQNKGVINSTFKLERDALHSAVAQAEHIDMENVCLFVDGELQAFCLYQFAVDGQHILVSHVRIGRSLPHIFNYVLHAFSKWFVDQGITHANLNADFGQIGMRMVKLAMGPTNFFRKYSIEPAQGEDP